MRQNGETKKLRLTKDDGPTRIARRVGVGLVLGFVGVVVRPGEHEHRGEDSPGKNVMIPIFAAEAALTVRASFVAEERLPVLPMEDSLEAPEQDSDDELDEVVGVDVV
ncbi:hypothetical protein DFH09DRAFT_1315507 [Mycena vulgaris]|nr:hypothetical protein DFH09DRAFT_1315507 [Mycena vulgaris]